MTPDLRLTIKQHFDHDMDCAVKEVFETMLGVECSSIDSPPPSPAPDSTSVLIGLAGIISGSCILQIDATSSLRVASLLTGSNETGDEIVNDALGEVCNMVAGAWKRSLPELVSSCLLSTPTVISGKDYNLHSPPQGLHLQRHYQCGCESFTFAMQCVVPERQ